MNWACILEECDTDSLEKATLFNFVTLPKFGQSFSSIFALKHPIPSSGAVKYYSVENVQWNFPRALVNCTLINKIKIMMLLKNVLYMQYLSTLYSSIIARVFLKNIYNINIYKYIIL